MLTVAPHDGHSRLTLEDPRVAAQLEEGEGRHNPEGSALLGVMVIVHDDPVHDSREGHWGLVEA